MSAQTKVKKETEAVVPSRSKRAREGYVISDKMNKTIIVEVTRMMQHPQFDKVIRRKIKYAAHDENSEAKTGDKVRIIQTRPLSKTKRWALVKVLQKKVI